MLQYLAGTTPIDWAKGFGQLPQESDTGKKSFPSNPICCGEVKILTGLIQAMEEFSKRVINSPKVGFLRLHLQRFFPIEAARLIFMIDLP